MKKLILPTLFILTLITFSCKKDNPYEKYEGAWSGTFTGDETGSWSANIDEDGKVSGTAVSDSLTDYPYEITGTISEEGKFEAQVEFFMPFYFDGQMTSSVGSGTWFYGDTEGTWTGEKR